MTIFDLGSSDVLLATHHIYYIRCKKVYDRDKNIHDQTHKDILKKDKMNK